MKTILSNLLVILISTFSLSQKELVNKYNYFSEVHGGMEDSGVSRTESFVFIAYASIEIKEIFYEGRSIYLKRGDSIVVNVNVYTPYNSISPLKLDTNQTTKKLPEIGIEDRYHVLKVGRIYYVNVQHPYIWQGNIIYVCKKNLHVAKKKEGFDTGYTGYAP